MIDLFNKGLKEETGRFTECKVEKGTDSNTITEVSSINGIRTEHVLSTYVHRKAVGGVHVTVNPSMATMRQLGFTDLAGTAWELTFLSWAADYFGCSSGLFYYMSPKIGVEVNGAWGSTLDNINCVSRISRYSVETGELIDKTEISSVRSLFHRFPVDGPSGYVLDINLDIYKLADLAALYIGLKTGFKGVIK